MIKKITPILVPFLFVLTTIYFSGKINDRQYLEYSNIILDRITNAIYTKDSIITYTKQGYKMTYKFGTSTEIERRDLAKNIIDYEIMISKDDNSKVSGKEFLFNMDSPAELNL